MKLWNTCGPVVVSVALLHTAGAAAGPVDIGVKDRANAFASIAADGNFVAIAEAGTRAYPTNLSGSCSMNVRTQAI